MFGFDTKSLHLSYLRSIFSNCVQMMSLKVKISLNFGYSMSKFIKRMDFTNFGYLSVKILVILYILSHKLLQMKQQQQQQLEAMHFNGDSPHSHFIHWWIHPIFPRHFSGGGGKNNPFIVLIERKSQELYYRCLSVVRVDF